MSASYDVLCIQGAVLETYSAVNCLADESYTVMGSGTHCYARATKAIFYNDTIETPTPSIDPSLRPKVAISIGRPSTSARTKHRRTLHEASTSQSIYLGPEVGRAESLVDPACPLPYIKRREVNHGKCTSSIRHCLQIERRASVAGHASGHPGSPLLHTHLPPSWWGCAESRDERYIRFVEGAGGSGLDLRGEYVAGFSQGKQRSVRSWNSAVCISFRKCIPFVKDSSCGALPLVVEYTSS